MTNEQNKGARVTTKRGDSGTTDLFGGVRVSKSSEIMHVLGACDYTQAILGLLKAHISAPEHKASLNRIQTQLYELMSELSKAKTLAVEEVEAWVTQLEQDQKKLQEETPIAHRFVIPGENVQEAWCQAARAQVRTLERDLCTFVESDPPHNKPLSKYIPYINRLSDYLFVLGQTLIQ